MLTRLEATTASANLVTMVKTAILVCDFVFCVKLFLIFVLKILENLMCWHMMSHDRNSKGGIFEKKNTQGQVINYKLSTTKLNPQLN